MQQYFILSDGKDHVETILLNEMLKISRFSIIFRYISF